MDPTIKWQSDHAAVLKQFLESETGELAVEILRNLRPGFAKSSDTNDIVRASGRQQGAEYTLENLFNLTDPNFFSDAPSQSNEAYPALDNDKAWEKSENK